MTEVTEDDLSVSGLKLYQNIDFVEIKRGRLEKDPITWEIHIANEVLKIEAEKLELQGAFRTQYLRAFNRPAQKIKKDEWQDIVELLAVKKAKVAINKEDSEAAFIAEEVFEHLCHSNSIALDGDEEDAALGRGFLYRDGLYLIKSTVIGEIVKDLGFKYVPNQLSTAMTQLGFKTEGTLNKTIKGKEVRVWGFLPTPIEQRRGN